MFTSPRRLLLALCIVLAHAAFLWALQNGLLRRAVETVVVPVQVLSEFIEPATPRPVRPPPSVPTPPPQAAAPAPAAPVPTPPPPPTAEPTAATATPTPAAPSTATTALPIQAPARIETPSSQAQYLQNPKPVYPTLSRRLGEQGLVMVRVLVGADGLPQRVELQQSSGFERLDQAALATVRGWRFVPGKRNGVPEAMWFNVPIDFKLE